MTKAQKILADNGIDIQGAANVFWAKNEKHSVDYAKKVYDAISKESTKAGIEKALQQIGQKLEKGLPL